VGSNGVYSVHKRASKMGLGEIVRSSFGWFWFETSVWMWNLSRVFKWGPLLW
jgi:hypothetical protein